MPRKRPPPATPEADAPETELLDLEQAMAMLNTSRPTFYRWLHSGRIQGIKVGRQWRFERAAIEAFLRGERPRVELAADPEPLLRTLEERLAPHAEHLPPRGDDPLDYAVQLMILLARSSHASDLHLDPLRDAGSPEPRASLRYRIDGVLHELASVDHKLLPALAAAWKSWAGCDLHERARPQSGQLRARAPWEAEDQEVELFVNILPTVAGESVVVRLLEPRGALPTLDQLRLPAADVATLRQQLAAGFGLIVCTGLTGTGKTTTLYAALQEMARPEHKVISLEHPVEALLPGVVQLLVNPEAGLSFPSALRAAMRSDPDVLMISEIRDAETMKLVQQVAMTGHLVLTIMHTEDAAEALRRMADVGGDPFLAAHATRAIVAHRLVRRLCPSCSEPADPPAELRSHAKALAPDLDWTALPTGFRRPKGCPSCLAGFRGRVLLAEILVMTPELRAALMHGAPREELQALAIRQGMVPLLAQGIHRAAQGEVALGEVLASQAF